MSNLEKRLKLIEEHCPQADDEPIFFDSLGNPWTEAEKAGMLQKHPDCDMFYKCMTDAIPHAEIVRRKENGIPLDAPWSPFIAGHASADIRKRLRRSGVLP